MGNPLQMRDANFGTLQMADLLFCLETGKPLKCRGIDNPERIFFWCRSRDLLWNLENFMRPTEAIYGVHWEVEADSPRWQLTGEGFVRLDVTKEFDAKYRLIAYVKIPEHEYEDLFEKCRAGEIPSQSCGHNGRMGSTDHILDYVGGPGDRYGWKVSNCARILPGWMHSLKLNEQWDISDSLRSFTKHPDDPFVVQFSEVPWGVFKRYWRKPINLNRSFHSGSGRSGYSTRTHGIDILEFDITMLRDHKCFFADFSGPHRKKRSHDKDMADWMVKNARAFRVFSDEDTPFVKEEAEFYFMTEWL